MSSLNPGGRRNADGVARVFGYDAIRRTLQKRGRTYDSSGSIASRPHGNEREIARRQRQEARKLAKGIAE